MEVEIRVGEPGDVDSAVSIYERSNLVRRRGIWPEPIRSARVAQVSASLRDPGSWFHVALQDATPVGMATLMPFREDRGAGPIVAGTAFLDLIYVVPDRWGRGIGGALLDAVVEEATRRGYERIHLWTHERDNERAHRLYRSRAFVRTGVTANDDDGEPVAEWLRQARMRPE